MDYRGVLGRSQGDHWSIAEGGIGLFIKEVLG